LLILLAGMASGHRAVAPIDQPQFIQIEPIEAVPFGVIRMGLGADLAVRVVKATWHSGKGFRIGISGLDVNGPLNIDDNALPWGYSVAPVHVGYDIVFSPRKNGFFYGMVPSCYAEATLGAFPPYAKVAAACDIDYYGVGTGIEVGVVDWNRRYDYPGPHAVLAFRPVLYAALKLRLLDAAFRLPGRR
jgi:hypothetical protein